MAQKHVVVIGGGNGSAISICALKQHQDLFDISAVISMSDSGGSSGRLRREFQTLPPGDIMRAVLAMSPYDFKILKQIFHRNRFVEVGKLEKHNLGNLFLILGAQYAGDFMAGVKALEQAVEAVGQVYPVTLEQTDLLVKLSNGQLVKTEAEIDRPTYDRSLKIIKAWLEPEGRVFSATKRVIEEADEIVLGPGSLYTSIVPALLVGGMSEAIRVSKARLTYIAGNAYELIGETGPTTLNEFVRELQTYLPRRIDLVVYNNHQLTESEQWHYQEKQWGVMTDDHQVLTDYRVIGTDFERAGGGLEAGKLGMALREVFV